MQTHVNVRGVYRRVWPSMVQVRSVYRPNDTYAKVNGVWRQTHEHFIHPGNIIGIRIVYTRNLDMTSDEHPELKITKQLPVRMQLTGDTRGNMDLKEKGVIFEYDHDHPKWEGVCVYTAIMYAVFADETMIPINSPKEQNLWEITDLAETTIQVSGYEFYESYGYYISGWNSILHKTHFLKDSNFDSKDQVKKFNLLNHYDILPAVARDHDFDSGISIGIARSLRTDGPNMVGSYGVLDHSYREILINGEPKPFVIEIYH